MSLDFRGARFPVGMGLRLSLKQAQRLEKYCRATDRTPPAVVRELIDQLPDMEAQTTEDQSSDEVCVE